MSEWETFYVVSNDLLYWEESNDLLYWEGSNDLLYWERLKWLATVTVTINFQLIRSDIYKPIVIGILYVLSMFNACKNILL